MNKTIPDEQEKRRLWRDIIKEAKRVTDAGGGDTRILKEYSNHGNRIIESLLGSDPDHMDH